jgi:hypothetical protein
MIDFFSQKLDAVAVSVSRETLQLDALVAVSKSPLSKAFRGTRRLLTSTVGAVLFLFFVLAAGGAVFRSLEADADFDLHELDFDIHEQLWEADPDTYVAVVGHPPASDEEESIKYGFLSFTIASTIGYGTNPPVTSPGRWFCIAFALFSIPTTGVCFGIFYLRLIRFWGACVSRILSFKTLLRYDEHDLDGDGNLDEKELKVLLKDLGLGEGVDVADLIKKWDATGDGELSFQEFKAKLVPFRKMVAEQLLAKWSLAFAFVIVSGWIVLGAVTFHSLEETWDYSTSFYFVVITLTTVGLGDIVPSTHASRLFLIVWASGGLSVVAILLGELGTYVKLNGRAALKHLKQMSENDAWMGGDLVRSFRE